MQIMSGSVSTTEIKVISLAIVFNISINVKSSTIMILSVLHIMQDKNSSKEEPGG